MELCWERILRRKQEMDKVRVMEKQIRQEKKSIDYKKQVLLCDDMIVLSKKMGLKVKVICFREHIDKCWVYVYRRNWFGQRYFLLAARREKNGSILVADLMDSKYSYDVANPKYLASSFTEENVVDEIEKIVTCNL